MVKKDNGVYEEIDNKNENIINFDEQWLNIELNHLNIIKLRSDNR